MTVDVTLVALADPTRRALVALLSAGARQPSELARELGVSRPAVSRHLRVLRRAGVVAEELQQHDARARVYALEAPPFVELQRWLDEVTAFWGHQLGAFKRHAERTSGKRGQR